MPASQWHSIYNFSNQECRSILMYCYYFLSFDFVHFKFPLLHTFFFLKLSQLFLSFFILYLELSFLSHGFSSPMSICPPDSHIYVHLCMIVDIGFVWSNCLLRSSPISPGFNYKVIILYYFSCSGFVFPEPSQIFFSPSFSLFKSFYGLIDSLFLKYLLLLRLSTSKIANTRLCEAIAFFVAGFTCFFSTVVAVRFSLVSSLLSHNKCEDPLPIQF